MSRVDFEEIIPSVSSKGLNTNVPEESKPAAVHAHTSGPEEPTSAAEFIHIHIVVLQESIMPAAEAIHCI